MWRNKLTSVAPLYSGSRGPAAVAAPPAPVQSSSTLGIADGIRIVGDIKGRHDLTIAGEVTGSVFLPANEVQIAETGDVHANITARVIEVEGNVIGDLKAAERVVIRRTSSVAGDIFSPQIQLEEGCRFRGSVQMREPDVRLKPPTKPRVIGEPGTVRIRAANE